MELKLSREIFGSISKLLFDLWRYLQRKSERLVHMSGSTRRTFAPQIPRLFS